MANRQIAIAQNTRSDSSQYSRYFTDNEVNNIFIESEDFTTSQYYNFSNFNKEIYSIENNDWGKTLSFEIQPGDADMLRKLSIRFRLPPLEKNGGTFASWTNSIAFAAFIEVELFFGAIKAATVSSEALEAFYTLKGKANDWSNSKNILVGKYVNISDLKNNAISPTEFIAPLHFWFSEKITNSIPLFLCKNNVTLRVRFRPFNEIVNYDGELPNIVLPQISLIAEMSLIKENVKTQFLYLRDSSDTGSLKYLAEVPYTYTNTSNLTNLPITFPVKELILFRRNLTAERNNDWFNYSEFGSGLANLDSIDIYIDNIKYTLNDKYGRLLTTTTRYNGTNRYIYTIPFFEKDKELSGFLPMDNIKTMSIDYNPSSLNYTNISILNTYNIIHFNKDGIVQMQFK